MQLQYFILIAVLLIGMAASLGLRKLTLTAALTGSVLGLLLYCGAGWTGIFLMTSFFILGTTATSWGRHKKEHLGIAEKNRGKRNVGQVLANGGVAAILGLLAWLYPQQAFVFHVMIAAAFASAAADTLSSELGSVYGKRFYNILTLKKDKRGLDGVISIEGWVAGLAGSFVIAAVYAIGFGWNINFLWIVMAGTIGNIVDSVLGTTLERRQIVNNDVVNFLNTLVAAVVVYLFHS